MHISYSIFYQSSIVLFFCKSSPRAVCKGREQNTINIAEGRQDIITAQIIDICFSVCFTYTENMN